MGKIEEILRKKGPFLSTELIKYVTKMENIKPDAARKRLSRLKPPISKIKGMFAENQAYYYLEEQYGNQLFYEQFLEALKKYGQQYYALIKAIKFHSGFLSLKELECYGQCPIENLKGHKKFEHILANLSEHKIIYQQDEYYKLNPKIAGKENFTHYKAIKVAKEFVLNQFNYLARNIGLISYDTGQYYREFSKFRWAFTAVSYIKALLSSNHGTKNPGFVVGDILIDGKIDTEAVSFFIHKIDIIKHSGNFPNFIPFLLVDNLELEALNLLKKKGIIIGFVDQLFGKDYQELLKALINVVKNAGAILKTNPEVYLTLISNLGKWVDGRTNNLRGDLFELAVGFYHSQLCQSIDIGKQINYNGERREIDVKAVYSDKIIVAECKGYRTKINKDELEEWLSQKVPIIRKWILDQEAYSSKHIKFEFWSSGGYSDDALELIENNETKKYELEFIDQKKMVEMAQKANFKKFKKILDDYYLKEI